VIGIRRYSVYQRLPGISPLEAVRMRAMANDFGVRLWTSNAPFRSCNPVRGLIPTMTTGFAIHPSI
jgi:hypothetical protein